MAPKKSSKKNSSRPRRASSTSDDVWSGKQRLQRVLAAAGYGSRRSCETLISEGRVEVDGEIVIKLGTTVEPSKAKIFVDGNRIKRPKPVYYALHKPAGVVTTNRDPQGRTRVVDLIPPEHRVFPVGRLDRSSEGLILLTNDGGLADQLTHPRYGVTKVYHVTVAGQVTPEAMKTMREGIYIAEGRVRVEGARIRKAKPRATDLEIMLKEGKNREIRRILARLGHKVLTLRRVAIGPLRLGQMPSGAHRRLTAEEVRKLQHAAREAAATPPPKPTGDKPTGDKPTGDKPMGAATQSAPRKRPAKSSPPAKPKTSAKPKMARGKPKPAGGKPAGRGPARRGAAASDTEFDFQFDEKPRQGSVIGEETAAPEGPPRRNKQAGAGRSPGKSTRQGTSAGGKRSQKKTAATRRRSSSTDSPRGRGGSAGGGRKPSGRGAPKRKGKPR